VVRNNDALAVHDRFLTWVETLPRREMSAVDMVVVHCTEEPTLQDARDIAERSPEKIAAHYYIDRDGRIERWVPDDRVAFHASGVNTRSIGIEIVNRGRFPRHFHSAAQHPTEQYSPPQLDSLRALLRYARTRLPRHVTLTRHSDVDQRLVPACDDPGLLVRRRIDPGPQFPWQQLLDWWHRDVP
jgi:N-acetylmuramoyl-L-alanine amidase